MLAIQALMPERPDFVFSGVNHGPNMGEDVLYSGTVAAAMEAVTLGVPGIGISFAGQPARDDGDLSRRCCCSWCAGSPACPTFPEQTLLNINLPRIPAVRGAWHPGHQAGQPLLLRVAHPDEGSLGAGDLLDRRRHDHLDRRRELRSPRRGRGLHLGHAAAHGSHQLLAARDGARDGRWRGRGGRRLRRLPRAGWWRRSSGKGIRDLAVLRAVRHGAAPPVRARERAAPGLRRRGAPDRQRPDHLAAVGAGPLPRAARRSPGASGCSRSGPGRATRRRCWRCSATRCSAWSGLPALAQSAREALEAAGHSQRHRAGGRRHAGLAPVRALRRDPGGGRVARDPGAAGGAARPRRPDGDPARRSRQPDADPRARARATSCAPAPSPTCASSRCSASSASASATGDRHGLRAVRRRLLPASRQAPQPDHHHSTASGPT